MSVFPSRFNDAELTCFKDIAPKMDEVSFYSFVPNAGRSLGRRSSEMEAVVGGASQNKP
jgi:hypothetical protein